MLPEISENVRQRVKQARKEEIESIRKKKVNILKAQQDLTGKGKPRNEVLDRRYQELDEREALLVRLNEQDVVSARPSADLPRERYADLA